mmetsp:Transcript_87264/g.227633  ORF Transcript_87264/g.227633 Transcript_87264/m.227633 type:complete len:398 (-) Transcript_87264:139-1332(-)
MAPLASRGLLALLAADAQIRDTAAVQLVGLEAGAKETTPPPSTTWSVGDPNTVDCPDAGDVRLSEDECRALVSMTESGINSASQAQLYNPYPLPTTGLFSGLLTEYPPGCSELMLFSTQIMYNPDTTGAPHPASKPICKKDYYSLFANSVCPGHLTPLNETECEIAAEAFHWEWSTANPVTNLNIAPGCYGKNGVVHFNAHPTGTFDDADAFSLCRIPDPPTSAPTPAPTLAPTTSSPISATGDPHMTSVTGAKFDIVRTGNHTLLHIPRHSAADDALIDVRGVVKHEGPTCLDMYIDALHITGKWADDRQFGGLSFFADRRSEVSEGWMTFGKLEFKVVHGTTLGGVKYLNLLARHLAKVDLPIGGILGLDDHSSAATPEEECKRSISLLSASTAE